MKYKHRGAMGLWKGQTQHYSTEHQDQQYIVKPINVFNAPLCIVVLVITGSSLD